MAFRWCRRNEPRFLRRYVRERARRALSGTRGGVHGEALSRCTYAPDGQHRASPRSLRVRRVRDRLSADARRPGMQTRGRRRMGSARQTWDVRRQERMGSAGGAHEDSTRGDQRTDVLNCSQRGRRRERQHLVHRDRGSRNHCHPPERARPEGVVPSERRFALGGAAAKLDTH